MRRYFRENAVQIALCVAAVLLCYGYYTTCGNIRIDTEALINHPGTTLNWFEIRRPCLVLLKRLLGQSSFHPVFSGILFMVFFSLQSLVLAGMIKKCGFIAGRMESVLFLAALITSPLWYYQFYFTLQQAEIACAMLLTVLAACCNFHVLFGKTGTVARILLPVLSAALLVFSLFSYQAFLAYYITICVMLFVLITWKAWVRDKEEAVLPYVARGVILGLHFILTYVIYSLISKGYFGESEYLDTQVQWGVSSFADCIKSILRSARDYYALLAVLFGWMLLYLLYAIFQRRDVRRRNKLLFCLLLVLLFLSSLLMVIYAGARIVLRSQFCVQVITGFTVMFCYGAMMRDLRANRAVRAAFAVCTCILLTVHVVYGQMLVHTDNVRYRQDRERSVRMLELLEHAEDAGNAEIAGGAEHAENAGNAEIAGNEANAKGSGEPPVVIVGKLSAEGIPDCMREEMIGWSFYEWDYNEFSNPTGATIRILGFLEAFSGRKYDTTLKSDLLTRAASVSGTLAPFPEEGCVTRLEEMTVVRLS